MKRTISPLFWRFFAVFGAAVIIAVVRNWPVDVPEHISGRARVVDGDSLVVSGVDVRLAGIDAPEGRQNCQKSGASWPCGEMATSALRGIINRERVTCDVEGMDKYDRLLGVCSIGRKNLNEWMVLNGWAVAYGRYSRQEKKASRSERGIWAGRFERPDVWRSKNMRSDLAAAAG